MSWHWGYFGLAAVISAVATKFVRDFAVSRRLSVSEPRDRDVHTKPTPRLGGVAITKAFLLVVLGLYLVAPEVLQFYPGTIGSIDRNLFGILAGVLLLVGVGVYDDIRGLNPWIKLAAHFAAGMILAWSAVTITHITNPFGGKIVLGAFAPYFVVGWVVFMINAINWLDGLDGMASGVSLISCLVLYFLAVKPEVNQMSMAVLAIILAGALAGFLPWNFSPAKIFLGDSGSQVLGFLLATFAIISGGKVATAFLVLGVPILDTIWVITRRVLTGQPIYQADRYHLHHRLLRAGLSQRAVVILMYTISAAFGLIALQTQSLGKLVAGLVLAGMMVGGGFWLVRSSRSPNNSQ